MLRAIIVVVLSVGLIWGVASAAQLRLPGAEAPTATPTAELAPAASGAASDRCRATATVPPLASDDATSITAEPGKAIIGPPEKDVVPSDKATTPSPEDLKRMQKGVDDTYLSGPELPGSTPATGPTEGTESKPDDYTGNGCP